MFQTFLKILLRNIDIYQVKISFHEKLRILLYLIETDPDILDECITESDSYKKKLAKKS